MGIVVKPNTFMPNTPALSSQVNANFDVLYNLVNGNIEEANIANRAVTGNKLAEEAVSDSKVSSTAGISLSKLAPLPSSVVPVTDSSGKLTSSEVTATELGRLSGVTSPIQSHVDSTNNPHGVRIAQVFRNSSSGTQNISGGSHYNLPAGVWNIGIDYPSSVFIEINFGSGWGWGRIPNAMVSGANYAVHTVVSTGNNEVRVINQQSATLNFYYIRRY